MINLQTYIVVIRCQSDIFLLILLLITLLLVAMVFQKVNVNIFHLFVYVVTRCNFQNFKFCKFDSDRQGLIMIIISNHCEQYYST